MKLMMKITFICAVAIAVIIPSLSFAGGNAGEQVIQKVQINSTGQLLIWGSSGDWANPDACDRSNIVLLMPSDAYYSEMYAFLVGSYLQGKPINGYLNTCVLYNGNTYPKLVTLTGTN